jgi:hypothetical protein
MELEEVLEEEESDEEGEEAEVLGREKVSSLPPW